MTNYEGESENKFDGDFTGYIPSIPDEDKIDISADTSDRIMPTSPLMPPSPYEPEAKLEDKHIGAYQPSSSMYMGMGAQQPASPPPPYVRPNPAYVPVSPVMPQREPQNRNTSADWVAPTPVEKERIAPTTRQSSEQPYYNETIKRESDKRHRQWFRRAIAIAVIVTIIGAPCIGFTIGLGSKFAENMISKNAETSITETAPSIPSEPASNPIDSKIFKDDTSTALAEKPVDARGSYAAVIDKVEPTVVSIVSSVPYEDPFGIYGGNFGGGESTGLGTGILFFENENKYYIVTNFHVIESASNISVLVHGSEPIEASVVGFDQAQDLAVVSISRTDTSEAGVTSVTLATFGNSDSIKVGDEVLAIGNALGEGNTATNGIVSAKDKEIAVQGRTLKVLQTNAAINPGNSGGPLVNLNGEVIGINTAKISEANTEGMGYSIPSNIAKPIIQGFMDSINKPFLGVTISTIDAETAKQFNLPSAGAIVSSIMDDSPAAAAGIKVNDIITGFNGMPVLTSEALIDFVRFSEVGETAEIKLIRLSENGTEMESMTINITLQAKS